MATRNYANETNWAAKKYGTLSARLDKDLVDAFKAALNTNETTYAEWLRTRILEYLGN